ncbi:MAG: hypothetical protein ACTSWQ_01495 [Candidatus Thorarchaeota archaeon]
MPNSESYLFGSYEIFELIIEEMVKSIKKIELELEEKLDYLGSLGESGLVLCYELSRRLNKPFFVIDEQFRLTYNRPVLIPNPLLARQEIEGILLVDSILKTGLNASIDVMELLDEFEKNKKEMPNIWFITPFYLGSSICKNLITKKPLSDVRFISLIDLDEYHMGHHEVKERARRFSPRLLGLDLKTGNERQSPVFGDVIAQVIDIRHPLEEMMLQKEEIIRLSLAMILEYSKQGNYNQVLTLWNPLIKTTERTMVIRPSEPYSLGSGESQAPHGSNKVSSPQDRRESGVVAESTEVGMEQIEISNLFTEKEELQEILNFLTNLPKVLPIFTKELNSENKGDNFRSMNIIFKDYKENKNIRDLVRDLKRLDVSGIGGFYQSHFIWFLKEYLIEMIILGIGRRSWQKRADKHQIVVRGLVEEAEIIVGLIEFGVKKAPQVGKNLLTEIAVHLGIMMNIVGALEVFTYDKFWARRAIEYNSIRTKKQLTQFIAEEIFSFSMINPYLFITNCNINNIIINDMNTTGEFKAINDSKNPLLIIAAGFLGQPLAVETSRIVREHNETRDIFLYSTKTFFWGDRGKDMEKLRKWSENKELIEIIITATVIKSGASIRTALEVQERLNLPGNTLIISVVNYENYEKAQAESKQQTYHSFFEFSRFKDERFQDWKSLSRLKAEEDSDTRYDRASFKEAIQDFVKILKASKN